MRPEAQSEMLSAALRTSSEVHFARDSEEQAQPHLGRASSFVTRANIGTALATLNVLQALGWDVPKDAQCRGLSNYPEITGQKGRWERVDLPAGPTVVFDGAHNVDSVAAAVEAIESFAASREGKVHVIWGAVADKDHSDVMALLPTDASYTWCAADIPRAMKGADVAKLRPELGGEVCESPAEALRHCIEEGLENDVIWVGGSLFVVGDALRDAPSVVPNWPDSASSDNPA
jgi:dihydrofolate synthase/folylpolyglutamate synthase